MIKVKQLTLKQTEKDLLKDFSYDFNSGEFWAILGKNGLGKTTFIKALAGFQNISEGKIAIKQQDIHSLSVLIKAQNIAFLPQNVEASLECTVKQSIAYGRYPWHKNSDEKKKNEKIVDDIIDLFELNDLKNKSIQQLSGGEFQRVEIATILAQNSGIMIFDEPLNHLDLAFRIKLMKILKDLSRNKLIIIVTHDIQYVQEYCSHSMMFIENENPIIGENKQVLNHTNIQLMLGAKVPLTFLQ